MTLENFIILPLTPQTQQEAGALATTLLSFSTGKISDIGVARQSLGNVSAGLNATNLDETAARLSDSLADNVGTLGFTLSTDDVGLALLLGTLDDETGPLSVLLGNLLLLDGSCELLSEGHVSDGDILEGDVELSGTLHQVGTDAVGDSFTLCDQLGGVELGHDGLEDFISNRGENTLVVIGTVGLDSSELVVLSLPMLK
jgi:hypothetical protein